MNALNVLALDAHCLLKFDSLIIVGVGIKLLCFSARRKHNDAVLRERPQVGHQDSTIIVELCPMLELNDLLDRHHFVVGRLDDADNKVKHNDNHVDCLDIPNEPDKENVQ